MSLDALRASMFWIVGVDSLAGALHQMSRSKAAAFFAYELDRSQWQGFRFYDLIFPLFVFIVRVSLVFFARQDHGDPWARPGAQVKIHPQHPAVCTWNF